MQSPAQRSRVTVLEHPYNAEAPPDAWEAPVTPVPQFYVRTHFPIPALDPASWRLRIDGEVERPLELSLDELRALPAREVTLTLECAGNGRTMLDPPPPGVQWGFGAVSTGRFTGVPLAELLQRAGVRPAAVEIAFAGADRGRVHEGHEVRYERALPPDLALDPDVLVAWALNGEPLRPEHGFPARLVVPRLYAMASVKWLTSISALPRPCDAYYQEHYRYVDEPGTPQGTPVTRMRVRSLIARPAPGPLPPGPVEVAGIAWSGSGAVQRVEVSVDGGEHWLDAELQPPDSPYATTRWRLAWTPPAPGPYTLVARATDDTGSTQPLDPVPNRHGYGVNAVHRVRVQVG